jgi:uncharacterized iron-regulated protein
VRFRKLRRTALAVAAIVALLQLLSCAPPAGLVRPDAAHPLLGRIWDVSRGRMVTQDDLLHEIAAARLILLGEVHDNPEHHRLQAEVLRAVLAQGRRPALAMEQFDREFQPAIDAALAQPGTAAVAIASAGEFDRSGWVWAFYEPLLALAVEARLSVVALNLTREQGMEVAKQGFAVLGEPAVRELAIDRSWSAARQAIMIREIADGHCGKLSSAALPRMVNSQRARDAIMADALIHRDDAGAIVIAGTEHVRNDIGVPVYLASRAPEQRLVSIGFMEVERGENTVADYVRPPAAALPFDYVWFTSAAQRDDPCAGLVLPNRQ